MLSLSLLNKDHWGRYKDLAGLLFKYGGREFVDRCGLSDALDSITGTANGTAEHKAEELASDLEELGPTFVKLGQVLSSRADMLPVPYLRALSRLQDEVEPFAYEDVERIFQEEFDVKPDLAFASFDHEPLAAASLGQVHRASMHDGREVVVKIQRPRVSEIVHSDLNALYQIAKLLDEHSEFGHRYHFLGTIRQFRRSIFRELDYQREAENLRMLGTNLAEFKQIVVPQPIDELTSPRVLTMEYMDGLKIRELTAAQLMEVDARSLVDQLFRAYLKQVLEDGFFHADPHPGNVKLTSAGKLALMDLGMTGQLDDTLQESLLNLLLAISEGRSDDAGDMAMAVGDRTDLFDPRAFRQGIREALATHREQQLENMQVGQLLLDVARVAGSTGLHIPPQITLLGKTLLNLDQVGRTMAPDFNPNLAIRRNAISIMRRRTVKGLKPGQMFTNLIDTKRFLSSLPRRIDRVMDALADNELQLRVNAIDEDRLISGIEKVANRVTIGLVLASLIVGASMLMGVDTEYRLMGYPALAIILFLIAAAWGVLFIGKIAWSDWREHHHRWKH